MKTKEEVIKEAWGKNYDLFKEHIDKDGWARYPHFQKHEMIEDVRPIEFRSQGTDFRPKSLQGIEDNNGWIKIESEDDLPKEGMTNYFICVDSKPSIHVHNLKQVISLYNDGMVSHYQPIEKPKSPLY